MGHHKVYIGTVEYPWSYLKYKRSFSVEAQKFVVKIPNLESFTPGTDVIKITRDGTLVAEGILAMGSWEVGDNVVTVLSTFDYRRKLQMLKGVFTAPATEAATHMRNQLADTGLHEDTYNNYGVITVDYGASANAYFDRRRIIEDACFMTGWEFKTDPDGGCDFKAQCGTDLSATIRFSREEGTLRDWDVNYVENGMQTVEKVTVIGEGCGSYQAYGSAQGGGYAAGDAETTINRKSLVTSALCATAAAALLADMDHILKYGVAKVINVNTGLAFDVFDTVNIVDEKLGIDEDLRVASITVEDFADGGESTQIEVCNIDHLQTSGETLIGNIRGRVEDDFSRAATLIGADSCQPELGTINPLLRNSYDKNMDYVESTAVAYEDVFSFESIDADTTCMIELHSRTLEWAIDGDDAYYKILYNFDGAGWVQWYEGGPTDGTDLATWQQIGPSFIPYGNGPQAGYGETVAIKIQLKIATGTVRLRNPCVDYVSYNKRDDL